MTVPPTDVGVQGVSEKLGGKKAVPVPAETTAAIDPELDAETGDE